MKDNSLLPGEMKNSEFLHNLLADMAKRFIAIDGLWFQEVEKAYGMEKAIDFDAAAWEKFSRSEAKRIMALLELSPNGGLTSLKKALELRMNAFVNKQEIIEVSENCLVLRKTNCWVQSARKRKNMQEFPCMSVGLVENECFASTIDHRIKTRCITCPPDDHPDEYFCAWEFSI